MVKGFVSLGVSFDRVRQDPNAWQDDAAYYRFPRYFKEHAAKLKATLGERVPPIAKCDQPDVLMTERVDKDGNRFLWVVNPPLFDAGRRIVVAYDSGNALLGAFRFDAPGTFLPLWELPFGAANHFILYPDTGEIAVNDYRDLRFGFSVRQSIRPKNDA